MFNRELNRCPHLPWIGKGWHRGLVRSTSLSSHEPYVCNGDRQNLLNSNPLGCVDSFVWVINPSGWLEIPTLPYSHLFEHNEWVHSKVTVTRASLPLAMNLPCIFYSRNSSIFRSKRKKKREVGNSQSNRKSSLLIHGFAFKYLACMILLP